MLIPQAIVQSGTALSQSYKGYNTIGGSFENMNAGRNYLKQATLTSAGLVTDIGIHVKGNGTNVGGTGWSILTDSGNSPVNVIAFVADAITSIYLNTTARWVALPCSVWLAAGTYWFGVNSFNTTDSSFQIAFDATGADKYIDSDNLWVADSSNYSVQTTANAYSIRISVLQ